MDLMAETPDIRPESPDLRAEMLDMRPERPDLRPERLKSRPERLEKLQRGGDEQTNKRTNERTKVPLCSTGLRPLWGRCPKRKQGRIHGYPSRVWVGRGNDEIDQPSSWAGVVTSKPPVNAKRA